MNSSFVAQIVKGFANHRRIEVLQLLSKSPNLSVEEISEQTNTEYKTIAVHVSRMHESGLVQKKYKGRRVEHKITPRGELILTFLRKLV